MRTHHVSTYMCRCRCAWLSPTNPDGPTADALVMPTLGTLVIVIFPPPQLSGRSYAPQIPTRSTPPSIGLPRLPRQPVPTGAQRPRLHSAPYVRSLFATPSPATCVKYSFNFVVFCLKRGPSWSRL